MHKPLIAAHRGASSLVKENTLASFAKAIEIGADMIEFDVRRTKDQVLIAYHNQSIAGRPVSELTYTEANELVRDQGVNIPLVEEVLKLTHGQIKLDVEIKETGYEASIVALLLKYLDLGEFVITSFKDRTVKTIKKNYPQLRVGLLLGYGQPHRFLPCGFSDLITKKWHPKTGSEFLHSLRYFFWDLFPLQRCHQAGADFLVPHYLLLRLGFLARAARDGKEVYVWTVNDPFLLKELLADPRVTAIISDRPDLTISLWESILKAEKDNRNSTQKERCR